MSHWTFSWQEIVGSPAIKRYQRLRCKGFVNLCGLGMLLSGFVRDNKLL
ncbi:MAG: hypothetical protein ACPGK1_17340 [bacterium]